MQDVTKAKPPRKSLAELVAEADERKADKKREKQVVVAGGFNSSI